MGPSAGQLTHNVNPECGSAQVGTEIVRAGGGVGADLQVGNVHAPAVGLVELVADKVAVVERDGGAVEGVLRHRHHDGVVLAADEGVEGHAHADGRPVREEDVIRVDADPARVHGTRWWGRAR